MQVIEIPRYSAAEKNRFVLPQRAFFAYDTMKSSIVGPVIDLTRAFVISRVV